LTADEAADRPTVVILPPVRQPRLGVAASAAVSLLLSASLVVVAPIGLLVAPLAVVPVAQWVAADPRRGRLAWAAIVAGLAALAVARLDVLGTPAWTFLAAYLLVVALPAASLDLWRLGSWREGRWAAVTTMAATAAILGALVAAAWPAPPVDAIAGWFRGTAAQVEAAYREMGIGTGELELAFDAVDSVVPWIAPVLPVAYLVIVLFWLRPRLPILGFAMPVAPFERYRGEDWLAAGFALFGLGTLLLGGTARWLAVNLLIVVLVLYFVQGLAMIRSHVARWIGRGWLVRWAVALLCLQGPLPLVVAALGIADGFYSLRPRTVEDGGHS
jgi:hypothetical protein